MELEHSFDNVVPRYLFSSKSNMAEAIMFQFDSEKTDFK